MPWNPGIAAVVALAAAGGLRVRCSYAGLAGEVGRAWEMPRR